MTSGCNCLTTSPTAPHPRLPAWRGLVALAGGLGAGADGAEAGSAYCCGGGAGDGRREPAAFQRQ